MRKLLPVFFLLLALTFLNAQPARAAAFYDDPSTPTENSNSNKTPAVAPAKQEEANKETAAPVKQEPVAAPEKPKPASSTNLLSGKVTRVINTATLVVQLDSRKQKKVVLFGIEKATGQIVGDLTIMIGMKGSRVSCLPAEQETYRCQTMDGMDIGKESLQKGIARALPSAPPEYLQAEGEAMKAKIGIWR